MSPGEVTLSVDPGIRGCGVAAFMGDRLVRAGYVRNPERDGSGPRECFWMGRAVGAWWPGPVLRLVLEWPQVYTQGKRDGDPNKLLCLAGVDAAVVAAFDGRYNIVEHLLPRDWKGTMDPDAMCRLVESRLQPTERAAVKLPDAESLQHNVWDGIGVGLHRLDRLVRRVYPR